MNIIQTDILDFNLINTDQASKILLMDNLLEIFSPLFHEELRKKQKELSNNIADIHKLTATISEFKKKLLKLRNDIEIESLKNQILQQIEFLNNIDVMYGRIKLTVQNVIASIDNQPLDELKKRWNLLQKITNERKKGM
jgi:hypothetical protein